MSEENAKNQLKELLEDLGYSDDFADYRSLAPSTNNFQKSTVTVTFPDGRIVEGTGEGKRRTTADIAAAQNAIDRMRQDHPDLIIDWDEIYAQAQAGDALIKLAVYLSIDLDSTKAKSKYLQNVESNLHLAQVFDRWKAQGDPDLAIWGTELSEHRKASLVESLLWKRFGQQVIAIDAPKNLQDVLKSLY
jgi:hypothetical protein